MPGILSQTLDAPYGEVCFADQEAELPASPSTDRVVWDPTSITVQFDDDSEDPILVDVYLYDTEEPLPDDLDLVFDGPLTLMNSGLLVFVPTGDEVIIDQIEEGPHNVKIYLDLNRS